MGRNIGLFFLKGGHSVAWVSRQTGPRSASAARLHRDLRRFARTYPEIDPQTRAAVYTYDDARIPTPQICPPQVVMGIAGAGTQVHGGAVGLDRLIHPVKMKKNATQVGVRPGQFGGKSQSAARHLFGFREQFLADQDLWFNVYYNMGGGNAGTYTVIITAN